MASQSAPASPAPRGASPALAPGSGQIPSLPKTSNAALLQNEDPGLSAPELRVHFAACEEYLVAGGRLPEDAATSFRTVACRKLVRLTPAQFVELSTDVYDELQRRFSAKNMPVLPFREDYHPKRNIARQKLATLPESQVRTATPPTPTETPPIIKRRRFQLGPSDQYADDADLPRGELVSTPYGRGIPLTKGGYEEEEGYDGGNSRAASPGSEFDDAEVPSSPGTSPPPRPTSSPSSGKSNRSLFALIAAAARTEEDYLAISDYQTSLGFFTEQDPVSAIVNTYTSRKSLLQLAAEFGIYADGDQNLRAALREDQEQLAMTILDILDSEADISAALKLGEGDAQNFIDAIHDTLEKGFLLDRAQSNKAHRMILKLTQICEQLPTSLFISESQVIMTRHDEHPMFGGGFGDIYRASYGGRRVALKHVRAFLRGDEMRRIRQQFYREALVWQCLQHPNILPFIGIDRETFPNSLCLVSPWMENGTVLRYLKEHPKTNVDPLLSQVAQGLEYLHSRNIVHGDLRGANILITSEWTACLADFGLTNFTDATSAMSSTTHRAGSLRWMAPELIDPDRFGLRFLRTGATDVYAFACVALELYTQRPPFTGISETAAMLRIIEGQRPARPEPAMSDALWDLVEDCWAHSPGKRPGMQVLTDRMGIIALDRRGSSTPRF
ncbi:Kinase-like protein [Mycena kentingensis (nom. inval.)]|nr:Kinase-like protein [Mycena kentingensis (nom. inval.)]